MSALRRGARVLAGALALVWSGCGSGEPPAWEQELVAPPEGAVVPEDELFRGELENGLHIIVLEDPRVPWVTLGVVVRSGAARATPDDVGLADFTAELMNRGAGERDALELANAVDALGASLVVASDWDSMTVQVSGLSGDLEALAEILGDVVLRPRFDEDEARRARSETLAGLAKAKDNPETLLRWNLYRALFSDHAYGYPKEGNPATVEKFDASRARALYRETWVPRDAIFYASGDADAKTLEALARSLFGAWTGGAPPGPAPKPATPAPTSRRIVIVDRPDLAQAQIAVAHEGVARAEPTRVAVELMNSTLGGGGFSSRIMKVVREDAGLAYFAYSAFAMRRDGGIFVASTATRIPEVGRSVELLLAELDGMRTNPPTAEELAHAKSRAVGRFVLSLETSSALVSELVSLDVQGLPKDSLDTYRSRIRAVTLEDVAQAARDRLHPERAAIVVVGPAEALRAQLEPLGPVEVVEP